jgi:hypothetical protein
VDGDRVCNGNVGDGKGGMEMGGLVVGDGLLAAGVVPYREWTDGWIRTPFGDGFVVQHLIRGQIEGPPSRGRD